MVVLDLNDPKIAAANPQAVVAMSKALSEYVEQKMTQLFCQLYV